MADVLKSAVVAAQWWAKKILDTANISNFDVGSRNQTCTMIALIGTLNATMHTPTPEAAETFGLKLQSIIMRELKNNPERTVLLQCKLFPSELLCEAAEKAAVDTSVFPLNRTMMVTEDSVFVSEENKPYRRVA